MVFLEQDIDYPLGNRIDRWWDARDGEPCGIPWTIVDSGFGVTCGAMEFEPAYRALVDQALMNPPAADVQASYRRTDNELSVGVHVTNRTATALGPDNLATINVLVYERVHRVHTDRFVQAVGQTDLLSPLAPGQTGSYLVSLTDVPVVDWGRSAVIVLVDYRPDPAQTRFAALQATVAEAWSGSLDAARLLLPLVVRGH